MTNNPLIGRTVTGVEVAADGHAIRFTMMDGEPVITRTDGDCCSNTWIESIQGVEQLIGSVVVSVEDVAGVRDEERTDDGALQFYGCKITTLKGYCLIDYRNESNGYYGGKLSWPGEYFYGGVFDQNVSKEEWKPVESK